MYQLRPLCPLRCFLLLLLSIYLLAPERIKIFLSKPLVYYCFLVFRRIGEYSLDLFYNGVHF